MFGFIKEMYIGLLSVSAIQIFGESLASNSKRPRKCVNLNNQPCQARATLTNVNSDKTRFIHLLLVLKSVMEFVALLMIHMLEFVFQTK